VCHDDYVPGRDGGKHAAAVQQCAQMDLQPAAAMVAARVGYSL
jgi:hypothetical protein